VNSLCWSIPANSFRWTFSATFVVMTNEFMLTVIMDNF
jgi:hypothetical protein